MSDLAALAIESYAHDVQAVAGELARATDPAGFAAALRELVELASVDEILVADDGNALVVNTYAAACRLTVDYPARCSVERTGFPRP